MDKSREEPTQGDKLQRLGLKARKDDHSVYIYIVSYFTYFPTFNHFHILISKCFY